MSALGRSAIGIDLSDGTLKAVHLTRRGHRIALQRTWRTALGEGPDAALAAAAVFMRSVRPGPGTRVVLSAPTDGLYSQTYSIPAMEQDRLAELVRYEVLAGLGQPDADVLIRHHVRRGVEESQVHAYALPRAVVDDFRDRLATHRISFDDIETPGFSLASFVEAESPAAGDRLLLGVGRRASDLVLLTPDGLWMRHLRLGLDDGPPGEIAERLAAEIDAAVAWFVQRDRGFRPAELLLTEEGALDARFTGALKRATALPVKRMSGLNRIRSGWRLRHVGQTPEQALSAGKAFGLALAGLGVARFRCPVVSGDARRAAMRRVPTVAAGVLVASATLIGLGETSEEWADRMNAALSPGLSGELLDRVRQRNAMLEDCDALDREAEVLLAIARRRPAVFAVRRALDLAAQVVAEQQDESLHVDQVWLSPAEPGRDGVMTVTLLADPALDDSLAERLRRVFGAEYTNVRVADPEPAPLPGLTRWVVELALP
ncbi:MAG: hypothetical protein ACYTG2_01495 [Planctomycetota bacterium]|jgi:hypothetical protein